MIASMGDSILETAEKVLFPIPTFLAKAAATPGQVAQSAADTAASVDAASRAAQDAAAATKRLATLATWVLLLAAGFLAYKYVIAPKGRRSRR